MNDFFTFYQNINHMKDPFIAFSMVHVLSVALIVVLIVYVYRCYGHMQPHRQRSFQRGMAYYFVLEEVLYTGWLVLNCHNQIWLQILPLELCSLCVYINACTVFFKKSYLQFFSAVVGLVAGLVAILYPANISELYPMFSYRVINFYILHGAFILFALIQLRNRSLFSYVHIKINTCMICSMFTIAFMVNLLFHSQYMFVGIPPKIAFIASVYEVTGVVFFLPTVLIVVTCLQFIVLFILRKCYGIKREKTYYNSIE